MKNELALVSAEDLSLVGKNILNEHQLQFILKRTPKQYVKTRPGKGGGQWEYVTVGYVKKCLNLMFGWSWNFEIIEEKILFGEVIVKGKLTCVSNGETIVKMQYGNKDIVYRRDTDKDGNRIPLSIGNDLKSAASDCLKKCASDIGIASDIYNKEDFKEVSIDTSVVYLDELIELFELKKDSIPMYLYTDAVRIIEKQESNSYRKLYKELKSL